MKFSWVIWLSFILKIQLAISSFEWLHTNIKLDATINFLYNQKNSYYISIFKYFNENTFVNCNGKKN